MSRERQVETSDGQLPLGTLDAVAAAVAGSSFIDGTESRVTLVNTSSCQPSHHWRCSICDSPRLLDLGPRTMDTFDSLSPPPGM